MTRGPEGLMEMTAPRVLITRAAGTARHLAPGGWPSADAFEAYLTLVHGGSWRERVAAGLALVRSLWHRPTPLAEHVPAGKPVDGVSLSPESTREKGRR